jgi:acyl-coenzyme A thioesterase PaaI-like protein
VALGGYPPATHFLGDLGFVSEVLSDTSAKGRTRVSPHVAGADGGARAGVVATLVDVVGGLLGVRILRPDWMATADLTVQLVRPAVGPFIEAQVELVRRGRTTMVLEALVVNVDDDGAEVPGPGGPTTPVGWCTTTFAVLPGGNRTMDQDLPFDLPTKLAIGDGAGLQRSLLEALGISVVEPAAGRVSLPVHPYVHNSIQAVQGGAMALLGDLAATEALGAATGLGSGGVVVTDLQVAYLTLGRLGPIVTRTTVLDAAGDGADGIGPQAASAVVELIDSGAEDRLTTVINARAVPVAEFDPATRGVVR